MAPRKRKIDASESKEASPPQAKRSRGRPANLNAAPTALASSMPKRKSPRVQEPALSSRPKRTSPAMKEAPKVTQTSKSEGMSKPVGKSTKATKAKSKAAVKHEKVTKSASKSRVSKNDSLKERRDTNVSIKISRAYTATADTVDAGEGDEDHEGPAYWLMKAEPESRIAKGKDVKFSIDDLENASEPEAWDGVRNPLARNNMRAMMKGDLAFFYHSNCKVPGIVGIMEIVEEHAVDESAFDPDHPYYDPKATRDNPKWCCVKVEYRRKFPEIIKLKELQGFAKDGGILANMQTLRMSRLSVSKVTKKEWDFIMALVDPEDSATSAA